MTSLKCAAIPAALRMLTNYKCLALVGKQSLPSLRLELMKCRQEVEHGADEDAARKVSLRYPQHSCSAAEAYSRVLVAQHADDEPPTKHCGENKIL